ncbi:MAG TPA: vWA domain-containing protein [Urbifossiella sp.]|nr:vWA domain-containing protein [Urbifossiella sp.]
MSRLLVCVAILALPLAFGAPAAPAQEPRPARPVAAPKAIDLVLCLDVSNSMDGLIDSAKLKLWDIVNELARLRPTPDLRVALYSYGHTSYTPESGWVKKELDLTADLDDVYKALNGLRTKGGTELVARVSKAALVDQPWSRSPGALKLLFVCGNEGVDQDRQTTLDEVADLAKGRGVILNTVYCGRSGTVEAGGWAMLAEKAGGKALVIDQNRALVAAVPKTEFDDQILKLGDDLGKTYLAYGKEGADRFANQKAQDDNALKATHAGPGGFGGGAPQAALARAASKAGELYRNERWDLIDKMKGDKTFDLAKVPAAELPADVAKLPPAERAGYVQKKADERVANQKRIADLTAQRQRKLDDERAKGPRNPADQALDEAVRGVVRDQARAAGFEVGNARDEKK